MTIINIILASLTTILTGFWLRWTIKSVGETYRPFVHFTMETKGDWLYMIIQNTGTRPAFNINITFDKPFGISVDKEQNEQRKEFDEKTKYNILSLGSNSKIEWKFDLVATRYGTIDYKNLNDEIYTVKIKYHSNSKKEYYESYELNIKNYIPYLMNDSELKNINDSIKKLTEIIKNKIK